MRKTGHLGMDEPFKGLFTPGMVTHETYRAVDGEWLAPGEVTLATADNERAATHTATGAVVEIGSIEKMSKSKKNVVDPDDIVTTYGADTARWFMLSDSPPERDVQWTEAGVEGASRFLQRIWKLVSDLLEIPQQSSETVPPNNGDLLAVRKVAHRVLKTVGEDIEGLRFNRAVAQIYELTNALAKFLPDVIASPTAQNRAVLAEGVEILVQVVAPMMPHLSETCWAALGRDGLVADAPWPIADERLLVDDSVTMAVQVNGKLRATIIAPLDAPREAVEQLVLSQEPVTRMLEGRTPKKIIIVPNRIVNVVI